MSVFERFIFVQALIVNRKYEYLWTDLGLRNTSSKSSFTDSRDPTQFLCLRGANDLDGATTVFTELVLQSLE